MFNQIRKFSKKCAYTGYFIIIGEEIDKNDFLEFYQVKFLGKRELEIQTFSKRYIEHYSEAIHYDNQSN